MSVEASTVPGYYGQGWDALLRTWQELDVPEGWRAEIVELGISLTPPPGNGHNSIAGVVNRALTKAAPDDWGVYQTLGICVPLRAKLYIPDFVVMPESELHAVPDNEPVSVDRALLVVEITSKGNADTDRKAKLWGYAHAPVPLYLLIDRFDENGPSATLFAEPEDGQYQQVTRVCFGESIKLPEPFNMTLDTADF